MDDLIPLTEGRLKPKEPSVLIKCLRPIRNALQHDGMIGRVTESAIYNAFRNIRMIWMFAIAPALWLFEQYAGHYLMSPADREKYEMRMLMETLASKFGGSTPQTAAEEEELLGPLAKAMGSFAWNCFDDVVFYWLCFDLCLWMVFKVVKWLTLEKSEDVQKVVEKKPSGLETSTKRKKTVLDKVVRFRVFRWWAIYVMVTEIIGRTVDTFVDFEALEYAREEAETQERDHLMTEVDFSTVNPFRYPFPPEQDWILREVIYMKHVLEDLSPTSLPGDDYDLISMILQNLSTRKDLSWRVYEETEISQPVKRAAERRTNYGHEKNPIAEEPFNISDRVEALSKHWTDLVLGAESPPERWEISSTTTFIPPLLKAHSLSNSLDRDQATFTDPGHALTLNPIQSSHANSLYTKWRKNYNRQYSYFKDHPPDPIGWVAVPKADAATRNDWNKVCAAWGVAQGRPVGKPPAGKAYKPIYSGSGMMWVPWDHKETVQPEEEVLEEIKGMNVEFESKEVRRKRQSEYLKKLRGEKEERERVGKEEL